MRSKKVAVDYAGFFIRKLQKRKAIKTEIELCSQT